MAETKNHLGLDKFQVTVIKSNYNSTKPIRKMADKIHAKLDAADIKYKAAIAAATEKYKASIAELQNEIAAYETQLNMLDKFTLETTKQACGLELTSEQVIKFLEDPAAFTAYKQQKEGVDMFSKQNSEEDVNELPWNNGEVNTEPRDLDAEEDKEWEDRINSGEIKENSLT